MKKLVVILAALAAIGLSAYPLKSLAAPETAWPSMRADAQNTGRSRMAKWEAPKTALEVARFHTGNGIFSTPVMDDMDHIFVGSADHYFYAFDPLARKELWRFKAGEIIDSAGALGPGGVIYFPSGDSKLYALNSQGEQLWAFDVLKDRRKEFLSLSTNYWWEGNVVIGPDGNLYAGNDDFFFYCLTPDGKLKWAFRTGFFIWAAASFDHSGKVYVASFDMKLYALDRATGKLKWKVDLKTPLVSSPAIGEDGTLYQGGLDGKLYALDSQSGKIKWTASTGDHIYASAAIGRDGIIYITSADGRLYAFDAQDGKTKWTYFTGDALRSSPALGPDPEAKADYLIYFGGGEGLVYAVDPSGHRRWSYDTLVNSPGVDYPNLNASPALGRWGLTLASAAGDVIYIPYDYYLRKNAAGISLNPADGFAAQSGTWHYISPGGLIDREPLLASAKAVSVRTIPPTQTITMRFLLRENGAIVRAQLDPASVKLDLTPSFKHRIEFQGDGRTVNIVPEEFLKPNTEYIFKLTANYKTPSGKTGEVSGITAFRVENSSAENPIVDGKYAGLKFSHMAVPNPPIVPSMDQIGIASTTIPFVVLEKNELNKTFVAWSTQRFGETETGEQVGVPDQRSLLYAFAGKWDSDGFIMEDKNCYFEATGFPMPLDELRFSGKALPDGTAGTGAGLLMELKPKSKMQAFSILNAAHPNYIGDAIARGGLKRFLQAAWVTTPAGTQMITRRIWKDWGFYNSDHRFVGVGTFRMSALAADKVAVPEGIRVDRFEFSPGSKKVIAELTGPGVKQNGQQIVFSILLVDTKTGTPVPLNYNTSTIREKTKSGGTRVTLSVPGAEKLAKGNTRAYLIAELQPLKKIEF